MSWEEERGSTAFTFAQHSLPRLIKDDKHLCYQREPSVIAVVFLTVKMTFPQKRRFSNVRDEKIWRKKEQQKKKLERRKTRIVETRKRGRVLLYIWHFLSSQSSINNDWGGDLNRRKYGCYSKSEGNIIHLLWFCQVPRMAGKTFKANEQFWSRRQSGYGLTWSFCTEQLLPQ